MFISACKQVLGKGRDIYVCCVHRVRGKVEILMWACKQGVGKKETYICGVCTGCCVKYKYLCGMCTDVVGKS